MDIRFRHTQTLTVVESSNDGAEFTDRRYRILKDPRGRDRIVPIER